MPSRSTIGSPPPRVFRLKIKRAFLISISGKRIPSHDASISRTNRRQMDCEISLRILVLVMVYAARCFFAHDVATVCNSIRFRFSSEHYYVYDSLPIILSARIAFMPVRNMRKLNYIYTTCTCTSKAARGCSFRETGDDDSLKINFTISVLRALNPSGPQEYLFTITTFVKLRHHVCVFFFFIIIRS